MKADNGLIDFTVPHLAEAVEKLTPEQIDALPFGAIRLDQDGKVTFFSARERLNSGFRQEALNRAFFTEIAPCLNTPGFRGRMQSALHNGTLDIEFSEFADLPNGQTDVELHVRMQSATGGGSWIFTQVLD